MGEDAFKEEYGNLRAEINFVFGRIFSCSGRTKKRDSLDKPSVT